MGKLRTSRVDRKPEAKGIDIHHPTAKFLPTIDLVYQRKVLDTRHIALLTGDAGVIDAKTNKRRYVATTNRLRKLLDNGYLVRWEAQRPDRFNPSTSFISSARKPSLCLKPFSPMRLLKAIMSG